MSQQRRWAAYRVAVALVAAVLSSGCRRCGAERARSPPAADLSVADRPTVLARLAGSGGSPASVTAPASEAAPPAEPELVFAERGRAVAYAVQDGATWRVVHNGRAGEAYSAVGPVVLSASGSRFAYPAQRGAEWRMVVDGVQGAPFTEVVRPVFSLDGTHLVYQANVGGTWRLVVDGRVLERRGSPFGYIEHEFSADGARLAFVERTDPGSGTLYVSDLAAEKPVAVDAHVTSAVFDPGRAHAAAISRREEGLRVVSVALNAPEAVRTGAPFDDVWDPVFGPGGASFAYVAERGKANFMLLDEKQVELPRGAQPVGSPAIRPGNGSVSMCVIAGDVVRLEEWFAEGVEQAAPPSYQSCEGVAYSPDGRARAYAAERDGRWFLVVNGKEGPPFDRIVTPAFSADGTRLVYRAREQGRRFVVVAGLDAKTVRRLPAYDQVFPVRFTADGKAIAYGVKDGQQLAWKVEPL
jgi:hypothetical protein